MEHGKKHNGKTKREKLELSKKAVFTNIPFRLHRVTNYRNTYHCVVDPTDPGDMVCLSHCVKKILNERD